MSTEALSEAALAIKEPCSSPADVESDDKQETWDADTDPVVLEARTKYIHLWTNEFRHGANGRCDDQMDLMPCTCKYDPEFPDSACGPGADCINRALMIECNEDNCHNSTRCRNRRFKKLEFAPIKIIKTEKKGFGLEALQDIKPGDFVIEYSGEIITQTTFVKRTREYSSEGKKHFYFMSLKKNEYIDAQKKGNWSRFMNHSCDPNCALQKWAVDNRYRIGIFAIKPIHKGQELSFDYKFERYGAQAQRCYCGAEKCKGYIGGDTKSDLYQGDSDDDELEIIESDELSKIKPIESVESVQKHVQKWIFSANKYKTLKKAIQKLEVTDSHTVLRRFIQYNGLNVLKHCLTVFFDRDLSVCATVLGILGRLPLNSRNPVIDFGIESCIQEFIDKSDMHFGSIAKHVLEQFSKLPIIYKIPKRKNTDSNESLAKTMDVLEADDEVSLLPQEDYPLVLRSYSRDKSLDISQILEVKQEEEEEEELPENWKKATAGDGKVYYYNVLTRETQWDKPQKTKRPKSPEIDFNELDYYRFDGELQDEDIEAAPKSDFYKEQKQQVSQVIVKSMSKYKDKMDPKQFKKLARKYTHQVLVKEEKRGKSEFQLDESTRLKIKKFVRKSLEIQGVAKPQKKLKH